MRCLTLWISIIILSICGCKKYSKDETIYVYDIFKNKKSINHLDTVIVKSKANGIKDIKFLFHGVDEDIVTQEKDDSIKVIIKDSSVIIYKLFTGQIYDNPLFELFRNKDKKLEYELTISPYFIENSRYMSFIDYYVNNKKYTVYIFYVNNYHERSDVIYYTKEFGFICYVFHNIAYKRLIYISDKDKMRDAIELTNKVINEPTFMVNLLEGYKVKSRIKYNSHGEPYMWIDTTDMDKYIRDKIKKLKGE